MHTNKQQNIWDKPVNTYLITTLCVLMLIAIWLKVPFDLVSNFHSSLLSIAIVLFMVYSAGYATVGSLVTLATMLFLFIFCVTSLKYFIEVVWYLSLRIISH